MNYLPLAIPLFFAIPFAIARLRWYFRTTAVPVPVPEDPLVVEARRLAAEEVAEMDWRFGTGEKPEHIIRQEQEAERFERARKEAEQMSERIRAEVKWREAKERNALEEADKAAADLMKLQLEHDNLVKAKTDKVTERILQALSTPSEVLSVAPIILKGMEERVRHLRITKMPEARTWLPEEMALPDEVEYEYVEEPPTRQVLRNGRGDVVMEYDEPSNVIYPRPRHKQRPHPGTRSGGPG